MSAQIPVSMETLNELRILLDIIEPHEHGEGMNECLICDEPILDAATRHLKKLHGLLSNNRLTQLKADVVRKQHGYTDTGVVLTNEAGDVAIVDKAAVRWLTADEAWSLMHDSKPQAPKWQESTDAHQVCISIINNHLPSRVVDKEDYVEFWDFAHAIAPLIIADYLADSPTPKWQEQLIEINEQDNIAEWGVWPVLCDDLSVIWKCGQITGLALVKIKRYQAETQEYSVQLAYDAIIGNEPS